MASNSGLRSLPATDRIGRGDARPGVRIEDRKFDLILCGIEVDEEVVHLVQHFLGTRICPIDLVQDDNRGKPAFERLAQDEPRLRQGAFRCVHQQHDPVDHRERAFDLAPEVRMARRVDDIDQVVAKPHGGVLGEDGDAAFALEIGVVHHALGNLLIGAERAALPQQCVDERGLAVIDVRDDREIAAQRIGDVAGFL